MTGCQVFDVAVIGTGAGGATLGYELAKKGRSVLFIERGKRLDTDPSVVRGVKLDRRDDPEEALRYGWWPDRNWFLGCGTGGSTALFAMVMERFRPEDFTPRRFFPEAGESSVVESWPVSYAEFEPFYERIENLYRVKGTIDPAFPKPGGLHDPLPPLPKEKAILGALSDAGLHPYRLHSACERVPECATCMLKLCPRDCRNDAGKICVRPAVDELNAGLVTECRAISFETEARRVSAVRCRQGDRELSFRARIFVLAAGALHSPTLLLASANDRFPNGLGNNHDLVGRNLMMHQSDLLLLTLKNAASDLDPRMNHGVMLMDFYFHQGFKLGNVHAHPFPTSEESWIELSPWRAPEIPKSSGRSSGAEADRAVQQHRAAALFATVLEDLPYLHNRVTLKRNGVSCEYRYPAELRQRNRTLFEAINHQLSSRFEIQTLGARGALNSSHCLGTCRFGDDPKTSVLDRDNRVHDLDNLYVVDSSFFPSSGGMNPSLTIAANALRVSEKIHLRL